MSRGRMFFCAQIRPAASGDRVLRAYVVVAEDESQAERLAIDAFPRPPAEFAAKWEVLGFGEDGPEEEGAEERPYFPVPVVEVPFNAYLKYRWELADLGELPPSEET